MQSLAWRQFRPLLAADSYSHSTGGATADASPMVLLFRVIYLDDISENAKNTSETPR
jgi:hypothetical protein